MRQWINKNVKLRRQRIVPGARCNVEEKTKRLQSEYDRNRHISARVLRSISMPHIHSIYIYCHEKTPPKGVNGLAQTYEADLTGLTAYFEASPEHA